MKAGELEKALATRDPWKIAELISNWSESDREKGKHELNVISAASGRKHLCDKPLDLKRYKKEIETKRKALDSTFDRSGTSTSGGLLKMARDFGRKDFRGYDYWHEMSYLILLAKFGIANENDRHPVLFMSHDPIAVKIMLDRQPAWMGRWIEQGTGGSDRFFSPVTVMLLRNAGHISISDDSVPAMRVLRHWPNPFPEAFINHPELSQELLREEPSVLDAVYSMPAKWAGKEWSPIIKWLREERLLDSKKMLQRCVRAMRRYAKKSEDRFALAGSIQIANDAKASQTELLSLQNQLIDLLSEQTPSIIGFALAKLLKIARHKKFKKDKALAQLKSVLTLSQKSHVIKAIKLINIIAGDPALQPEALDLLIVCAMHAEADVQEAALTVLASETYLLSIAQKEKLAELDCTVAAHLRQQLAGLADAESRPTTETVDDQLSGVAISIEDSDFDSYSPRIRKLLRIDEALGFAKQGQIDPQSSWPILNGRVLDSTDRIDPIADVESLVDVVAAASQVVEDADVPDQILGGIARHFDERDDLFHSRTANLYAQVRKQKMSQPTRGLYHHWDRDYFRVLIKHWLRPDGRVTRKYRHPLSRFVGEMTTYFSDGKRCELVSTPTHQGGWIDPVEWVERLHLLPKALSDFQSRDLVRSMLRLAPDRREEACKNAKALPISLRKFAICALGGNLDFSTAKGETNLWVTACRARDPNLVIPQSAPFSKGLMNNEVLTPLDTDWSIKPGNPDRYINTIESPLGAHVSRQRTEAFAALKRKNPERSYRLGDWTTESEISQQVQETQEELLYPISFQLIDPTDWSMPAWYNASLANLWPSNLDWYFFIGMKILLVRVNKSKTTNDRPDGFLFPLLQKDRPLTLMAARALWTATTSKDDNARSTAIEVWIAIIDDDRADMPILNQAFVEVEQGGWFVYARIIGVLDEVGSVSPLHAWIVSMVLHAMIPTVNGLTREMAKILQCLLKHHTLLGIAVPEFLKTRLRSCQSGKAKSLATKMLKIEETLNPERVKAIRLQLDARASRAQRFSSD